MTIPLVYDLSVVGEERIKRVLRGVESEVKASASRVDSSARSVGGRRAASLDPERIAAKQVDQIAKLARAEEAAMKRTERARVASEKQVERERLRVISRASAEEEKEARKIRAARLSTAKSVAGGVARGIGSGIGRVANYASTGLTIGAGVFGLAAGSAVQSQLGTRSAAAGLANQAYGNPGENRSREQIAQDVLKQVGGIDKKTGVGEENAIGGLRSFSAISGELGAAQKLLPFLVNLADAADANVSDLGGAAGQTFKAVNRPGVSQDAAIAQTKEILSSLTQQSKIGSIELRDYAAHMVEITQAAGRFTGRTPEVIAFMSALAQLNGYDAAEATTAIARIPSDLITNQKKANKILGGTGIYTDKSGTALKDPRDILVGILEKTHGNLGKAGDIFQERSLKAFEPLRKAYVDAEVKKKGSGTAAVDAILEPFLKANLSEEEINKSAGFRQSQEDRELDKVKGDFNRAIGRELLPVISRLIPKISDLIPKFAEIAEKGAKLAEWFIENPFKGLGAAVGVSIAADLASAGIGAAAKMAIEKALEKLTGVGGSRVPVPGTSIDGTPLPAGPPSKTAVALAAIPAIKELYGVGKASFGITKDIMSASTIGNKGWSEGGSPIRATYEGIVSLLKGPSKPMSGADYDRYIGRDPEKETPTRQLYTGESPSDLEAARLQKEAAEKQAQAAELMKQASEMLKNNSGPGAPVRILPMASR